MNKEAVTTVAVIAVIGVVAYMLVKNVGAQQGAFQLAQGNDGPDSSLIGVRSIASTVKGWFGMSDGPGMRSDGSLDVKSVRVTDPAYAGSSDPGFKLSLGAFES